MPPHTANAVSNLRSTPLPLRCWTPLNDIALLDICMPGMLGTELAREILGHSENTDIVFLTTSADYAVDAFSIHAADYIQKPYTKGKFEAALDRVIAMRQERTWIVLPCEGELHRIALEDVLYVETDEKRRIFALASGKKMTAPSCRIAWRADGAWSCAEHPMLSISAMSAVFPART